MKEKINPEVIKILKEKGIEKNNGILYLLGLFYNIKSDLFEGKFKESFDFSSIFEVKKNKIHWKISLFEDLTLDKDFYFWVKENYVYLFESRNEKKGGHIKESVKRLSFFLKKNPEISLEDILEATKNYLENTDPLYIRDPHYFIFKNKGKEEISDLLSWIEKTKEEKDNSLSLKIMI